MALILNLETATTNCSVSIARDGNLLILKEHNTPSYSHSEQLHVFIQEVLKDAKVSINQLDAIAVSKGPGSYTGLRIGVSAAKGLCFALNLPLISIATLESMAHQVKIEKSTFIISLLDARRMEVYAAVYDHEYKEIGETKAEIVEGTSFASFAKNGKVLLIGSGAEKCREILAHPNFDYNTSIIPSAREMCALSYSKFITKDFEDVAYFEPYYLKDFILQTKAKK